MPALDPKEAQATAPRFPLDPDTEHSLRDLFTCHAPSPDAIARMQALRSTGCEFARSILACCPRSADRSAALRHLREAIMTANASIALSGRNIP